MRVLSLLIGCLLLAGMLSAQTFTAALIGGFNLSQLHGDKLGGYNQIGFNTGARVDARLNDRWSLSIEMLYSQQGSSRVKSDDPASIYRNIRLNFVEAPVMINFHDWKILASAGLSYARLIDYTAEDVLGTDITDLENFDPNVISMIFGATYLFSEKWGFNVRWSRHLTNLKADPDDGRFTGLNVAVRMYYML